MISISIWIISTIIFFSLVLGLLAFMEKPGEKVNRAFLWTIIFIVIWQLSNFLENENISPDLAKILLRIDFASAIIFAYFWFVFALNFSRAKRINIKPIFKKIIFIFTLLFSLLSFTDLVLLNISSDNGAIVFDQGPLWVFYGLGIIGFFIAGSVIIILNLLKSQGSERIQTLYVLVGFSISSIIAIIINLFLANYLTINQARIGLYGYIIFIVLTFYAIIKHHLFNIKVIATELFTLGIWLVLLFRTFLSGNNQELAINAAIFASVATFGILLIRSVIKEVEQKEKIEQMAKDMEKAYEVEKKANEQLEALSNVKNQFLMTIQHHLRTPLTSMRGYADLLLGEKYGKLPKKVEEVIKKFEASTTSLIKMVNDFLDITQFQLGKKTVSLKDGVNLCPILEEIAKDSELQAKNKGIYLKFEKPEGECFIKADESKLKAAIVNILDNSIKYTKEGGTTMTVKANNGKAIIAIKDTGMGISKERLAKLFVSTFERSDEAKKAFSEGRGIGLYLSREIIEAHEGRIWAESEGEGKGATFFIELPVK